MAGVFGTFRAERVGLDGGLRVMDPASGEVAPTLR